MRRIQAISLVDRARLESLLTQARHALEQGDGEAAEKAARAVIEHSDVTEQRRQAAEVLVWATLGRGQQCHFKQARELLMAGPLDPLLQAAILEADGDAERAIACLRQARLVGDERPQLAASLIRLLLAADRYGEAALTTIQILDHVSEQEARQVIAACLDGGRPVPAAELGIALFTRTSSLEDLAWALVGYAASGNRTAVDKTLAMAVERQLPLAALLESAAFETLAPESELRQLVTDVGVRTSEMSDAQ